MPDIDLRQEAKAFESRLQPTFEDLRGYMSALLQSLSDINLGPFATLLYGRKDIAHYYEYNNPADSYRRVSIDLLLNAKPCETEPTPYLNHNSLDPAIKTASYIGTKILITISKENTGGSSNFTLSIATNGRVALDYIPSSRKRTLHQVTRYHSDKRPDSTPLGHHHITWNQKDILMQRLVESLMAYASNDVTQVLLPAQVQPKPDLPLVASTLTPHILK